MKTEELRRKSKEELKQIESEEREKLRSLRFDLAAGKKKNVKAIRNFKRDIARIKTIIREKETDNQKN